MERRSFLRRASLVPPVATIAFLTGCLGGGGSKSGSGEDGDGNTTDGNGENGEQTEGTGVSLGKSRFEVLDSTGGTRGDSVSVAFAEDLPGFSGEDVQTVSIEGSLTGKNSCYTAELESAEYDPTEDVFEVSIRSFEDRNDEQVCTQVITEVEYGLIASFEGGLPGRTVVRHDGGAVAEAIREA